jgi:amino acid adenylation domain-containing protein
VRWVQADVEQSLPARFARIAAAHRTCLALDDSSQTLTYGELDGWSNTVANALLDRLGPGVEPVALLLAQGAASAAATLGVLKAGKAYVPLDPGDPPARVRAVLERVGARLLVHDGETAARAQERGGAVLLLDVEDLEAGDGPPSVDVSPDDVAYVFFTSGTTGRPKGVFDSHRNVLHNVLRYTNALELSAGDRLTLLQAPAFSGAVSSLFCALLNGAQVFPARPAGQSPAMLARWLRAHRLTAYHSVPALFRTICAAGVDFPDVRVVRLEGDRASALDADLHRARFAPHCVLANGLGTTETGLARQLRIRSGDPVEGGVLPVGYPVTDVEVAVVDDAGAELPVGATGEIVVRSAYLALGYWDEPELTARTFLDDPAGGGVRTYRTSDVGRLRADGCLEYLGRRDFQLKVHGHRVDPAEVESALLRLPVVRDAVVTTVEGRRGEGRLVAYVLPETALPPAGDLRAALAGQLPAHLIPSAFVAVPELPLGPNGKLDRRALPDPGEARATGRPPDTEVERLVARVWQEVLGVPVGVDDDFFELGGDSLAAAEILAAIESRTGRRLADSLLLRAPTVAELAAALDAPATPSGSVLVPLRHGAGTPIVLVHGADGDAAHFVSLVARLDVSRTVLAVESSDPAADLRPEALARRHVETLEAAGVAPPYVLVGHCYGAIVALEMARQLQAKGSDVGFLGLVGITPGEFPGLASDAAEARWARAHWLRAEGTFLSRTARHAAHALRLPRGTPLPYLRDRVAAVARKVARRVAGGGTKSFGLAAQEGLASYAPAPYAGEAVLFLSEESAAAYTPDPARDWQRLAAGGVRTLVLPGSDIDLLRSPAVDRLAEQIRAYGS